ncbi:MAG: hypothetical protein CEN88_142 [Candidatus Berkelbacteria bacterium Licking1014_2]|uniref:Rod shape-determining protein MreD n=1 Tax=Candidatus Berkelbacteria bacterium Licking1014_2 TaxID=2017146 RepID=A0A554LWC1_9BACT|nr:MAG: hypothetical protein CEN88_142 [Candidatus Berkelbacteria bacterium Licking1014_2]
MMIIHFFIIILLAIGQGTFLPFFSVAGAFPSLLLATVSSFLLVKRYDLLFFYLAIGGLIFDLLASGRFGVITIGLTAMTLMMYFLSRRLVYPVNFWQAGLFFLLSGFIWQIIFWTINWAGWTPLITAGIEQWLIGWLILFPIINYCVRPEETIKIQI